MTNQYTNLDKVELARSFPDIVAMKDGIVEIDYLISKTSSPAK